MTQLIAGASGGPVVNGHDGYLFHMVSTGGLHYNNSVQMIERGYPVRYIRQELVTDALGCGKWDGGPAVRTVLAPTEDPVTFSYVSDGYYNRPLGAAGGLDGTPTQVFRARVSNGTEIERLEELPTIHELTLHPGEALDGIYSSSGGYGNSLERDPELVRHRAREGWISVDKAREVYGVVLLVEPELFAVDRQATEERRRRMRRKKSRSEP